MKSLLLTTAFLLSAMPLPASAQPTAPNFDDEQANPAEAYIPAKIDADGKRIVEGLNRFSGEIYSRMMGETGDIAISPASISTAFGLAYAGARGKTANDIGDFHKSYGALLGTMQLSANGRTMAVNNSIWLQNDLPVRDEYLTLVNKNYGAGLNRVDYASDPDAARSKINRWVENKTNNKIRDLLIDGDIHDITKSVLVNTVYFKADWAEPFDKAATKQEKFKATSGKKIMLLLMHQRNRFAYAERDEIQIVSMPYRGGETDMVILLPKPNKMAAMEKKVANAGFASWMDVLLESKDTDAIVTMPKFKIEKRYAEVADTLQDMGMVQPFGDSDFTAMKPLNLKSKDPNDWNLTIGKVIHKVFVEVEEKGTEAAAATATAMEIAVSGQRRTSPPPPPKIFRADHPFMFLIRDRRTGAILFVGRFTGDDSK